MKMPERQADRCEHIANRPSDPFVCTHNRYLTISQDTHGCELINFSMSRDMLANVEHGHLVYLFTEKKSWLRCKFWVTSPISS